MSRYFCGLSTIISVLFWIPPSTLEAEEFRLLVNTDHFVPCSELEEVMSFHNSEDPTGVSSSLSDYTQYCANSGTCFEIQDTIGNLIRIRITYVDPDNSGQQNGHSHVQCDEEYATTRMNLANYKYITTNKIAIGVVVTPFVKYMFDYDENFVTSTGLDIYAGYRWILPRLNIPVTTFFAFGCSLIPFPDFEEEVTIAEPAWNFSGGILLEPFNKFNVGFQIGIDNLMRTTKREVRNFKNEFSISIGIGYRIWLL